MVSLPDSSIYWRVQGGADDSWTLDADGVITPTAGDTIEAVCYSVSKSAFITADTTVSNSGVSDQDIVVGSDVSIDVSSSFTGSNVVYTLAAAPAWLAINPTTGVITGTAPVAPSTGNTVTVRATNADGSSEASFNIDVVEIPTIILAFKDDYPNKYIYFDQYNQPQFKQEVITPTPEMFVDPFINDRYAHWHRMIVGISTPNGYKLTKGLPIHPNQKIGAGDYTLSGPDAALFTVKSKNHATEPGGVELTDATSVTTAGTDLEFDYNTPAGGTYRIKVPVYSDAGKGTFYGGSHRFFDNSNPVGRTDHGTDGGEPHLGLEVFNAGNGSTSQSAEEMFIKRGTEWADTALAIMYSWPTARNVLDYGDPAEANWKVTVPANYSRQAGICRPTYSSHNGSGARFEGGEIDLNNTVARCGLLLNEANVSFVRMIMGGNIDDPSSNGVYLNNATGCVIRHCKFYDDTYGDGVYRLNSNSIDCSFNDFGIPGGSAADNMQSTNEFNDTENNRDLFDYYNIGRQEFTSSSNKGSSAAGGTERHSVFYNVFQGKKFAIGFGSIGVMGYTYGQGQENVVLAGNINNSAELPSGNSVRFGCFMTHGDGGLTWSGFDDTTYQGGEFQRFNEYASFNVGAYMDYGIEIDRGFAGTIKDNYFFDIDVKTIENRQKTYVVSGNVSQIEPYSGPGGDTYMRVTTESEHFLSKGDVVTITDTVNPANNGTWTIGSLSDSQYLANQFNLGAHNSAVASSGTGSQITFTITPKSKAILSDNIQGLYVTGSEVRVDTASNLNLQKGMYVLQEGFTNAENNGFKRITRVKHSFLDNDEYYYQQDDAIEEASPSGTPTYTAVQETIEQNLINNNRAPSVNDAPRHTALPVITGDATEGNAQLVTFTTPAGTTAIVKWHTDGVEIESVTGQANPTLPGGVGGRNPRRAIPGFGAGTTDHERYADLDKYHLGCVIEFTNTTTGYKYIQHGVWSDNNEPLKKIVAKQTPADVSGVTFWAEVSEYMGDDGDVAKFLTNLIDQDNPFVNTAGTGIPFAKNDATAPGPVLKFDGSANYLALDKAVPAASIYLLMTYKDGTDELWDFERNIFTGKGNLESPYIRVNDGNRGLTGSAAWRYGTQTDLNGDDNNNILATGAAKIVRIDADNFTNETPTDVAVSGTTVTITTSNAHEFTVGMNITNSGFDNAANDGVKTITAVPSNTTFEYEDAAAVAETPSGSPNCRYLGRIAEWKIGSDSSTVTDLKILGAIGVVNNINDTPDENIILDYWGTKNGISKTLAPTNNINFLEGRTETTDAATHTFSGVNLGTEDAGRYVLVAIEGKESGGTPTVTSATIGGVAATVIHQANRSGGAFAAIIGALVPMGTTGDVVVNYSATILRASIQAYETTDITSLTATDTATDTSEDPSLSIDIAQDGIVIAAAFSDANSGSATWSGATEDYEASAIESQIVVSSASYVATDAETARAISCNFSESGFDGLGIAVALPTS